ncbi:MAG: RNA polymerase sigma factor [Ardenticatenaceae bacterium]|nr:RNA polymerase sigma factor [Ardenticatenaceae bacterium]
MIDDKQLIQAAQQGNREAIGALYAAYHARVYRYVAFRVGDPAAADDLTAEVFVTMVKRIQTYEYRGRPFLAWLYIVAGNIVKMHYRQEKKRQLETLPEELVDQASSPAEIAETRLSQRRLLAAMPFLSDPQREVILLKFIEGLSNSEVAEIMGKTEGAIRILQHRALTALRQTLRESGEVLHGSA